ncbi:three-helix bundle dimerization domain-containing protein [Streptomyces goshikiensis]|uniref:three-helix bundle dimerization domain-containing protein n=1 Tax=Streptomyces goshikiensis TaxID=1942 RepID=UPI0036563AAE
MTQRFHDEDGTLQHLADRLVAAYPDIDAHVVEATVDEASRELSGAKLKTFLPILAERRARLTLDRYRASRPEASPEGA